MLQKEKLLPGSRLPSERELCELLDSKRMTLRQVLKELELNQLFLERIAVGGLFLPLDSGTTQNPSPVLMLKREVKERVHFGDILKLQSPLQKSILSAYRIRIFIE